MITSWHQGEWLRHTEPEQVGWDIVFCTNRREKSDRAGALTDIQCSGGIKQRLHGCSHWGRVHPSLLWKTHSQKNDSYKTTIEMVGYQRFPPLRMMTGQYKGSYVRWRGPGLVHCSMWPSSKRSRFRHVIHLDVTQISHLDVMAYQGFITCITQS